MVNISREQQRLYNNVHDILSALPAGSALSFVLLSPDTLTLLRISLVHRWSTRQGRVRLKVSYTTRGGYEVSERASHFSLFCSDHCCHFSDFLDSGFHDFVDVVAPRSRRARVLENKGGLWLSSGESSCCFQLMLLSFWDNGRYKAGERSVGCLLGTSSWFLIRTTFRILAFIPFPMLWVSCCDLT